VLYVIVDIVKFVVFVCVVERQSGRLLFCLVQTRRVWMCWNIVISYSRFMLSAPLRVSTMGFLLLTWSALNAIVLWTADIIMKT